MSDKMDLDQTEASEGASADESVQKSNRVDVANSDVPAANRRELLKAVLAAPPVLMTLTSRPVHAIQGLSNMLSGDASECRGDTHYGGMSPGFWKALVGSTQVYGDTAAVAWGYTGYEYGTFTGSNDNKWGHYTGGTPYGDVFGGSDTRSLREVLNTDNGSDAFHLIAGLLNCRYFDYKAGGSATQYFMTTQQFWQMYDGKLTIPPGYSSLRDLVESSYHAEIGDACDY